jgi:hypothetical protein
MADQTGKSLPKRLRSALAKSPRSGSGANAFPSIIGRLRWSPFLALVAIVVFGLATGDKKTPELTIIGVATMGGAAAFMVGALGGFLFGLPKTVAAKDDPNALVVQNSNLNEISDWLTKILVGLGLVQLGKIHDRLGTLGNELAQGLGGTDAAKAFALSLLIYGAVVGFMLTYLWTRMRVTVGLYNTSQHIVEAKSLTESALPTVPALPTPPG